MIILKTVGHRIMLLLCDIEYMVKAQCKIILRANFLLYFEVCGFHIYNEKHTCIQRFFLHSCSKNQCFLLQKFPFPQNYELKDVLYVIEGMQFLGTGRIKPLLFYHPKSLKVCLHLIF